MLRLLDPGGRRELFTATLCLSVECALICAGAAAFGIGSTWDQGCMHQRMQRGVQPFRELLSRLEAPSNATRAALCFAAHVVASGCTEGRDFQECSGMCRAVVARGNNAAKDFLMHPTKSFSFVIIALLLAACSNESAPEAFDEQRLNPTQPAEYAGAPETGESCHVVETALVDGTMTEDNSCCGTAICSDRETCGADYGSEVQVCSDCDETRCDAGRSPSSSLAGGDGSNHVTPEASGGLNGTILIKPAGGGLNGSVVIKPQ